LVSGYKTPGEKARPDLYGINYRPGDWDCPDCNAHCFASKTLCFKCNARKPEGSKDSQAGTGDRTIAEMGFADHLAKEDGMLLQLFLDKKLVDHTTVSLIASYSRTIVSIVLFRCKDKILGDETQTWSGYLLVACKNLTTKVSRHSSWTGTQLAHPLIHTHIHATPFSAPLSLRTSMLPTSKQYARA
jgi:hypothetical protein